MQLVRKIVLKKAVARQRSTPTVAFHISDVGVASVAAADVLSSGDAKIQIDAVRKLRLAADQGSMLRKK